MDNFEIDISFSNNYHSKKELTKEDFKGAENLFSIFDKDNSGTLSAGEIRTIFSQVQNSSDKNTKDKRSNEYAILDGSEAEHFISQNKDNAGNTYKDLGVDISQVFNFFNVLKDNYIEQQEEVEPAPEGNLKSSDEMDREDEDSGSPIVISERAKQFLNIPERGEQQFTEEECARLDTLTDEELEQAKQFFFVPSRTKQFSAEDIVALVTESGGKFQVNNENYQRIDELISLKDSAGNELDGRGIVHLMTLPSAKIDTAIQLLTLKNRENKPLQVHEVIYILNCDSQELIDAVRENPNLTDFYKVKTDSLYYVSAEDKEKKVTYRYIKGQQYPEEITEEKIDDNSFRRIVYNRNLNIRHIMLCEGSTEDLSNLPIRIETQHLDTKGEVESTEVYEVGNNPGTPDVYTIDSDGNKTYLQQTIVDEQTGNQTILKRFTDHSGNLSEFSYSVLGNDEYNLEYTITDSQGNKILQRERTLKKLDDNHFEYSENGHAYSIEMNDNQVTITDKSDNKSYSMNLDDYILNDGNPDLIRENIHKIPADILVFLTQNPLRLSYAASGDIGPKDNQGLRRSDEQAIDIGTITMHPEGELNNSFMTILLHELGHYIDNTESGARTTDVLSQNEDFIKIYKEELEEFNRNHTVEEQTFILQFNGIGYAGKSPEEQRTRTISEVFAESNMASSTNSKSWTAVRSYYLQRYFPRTIAKAQELLAGRTGV